MSCGIGCDTCFWDDGAYLLFCLTCKTGFVLDPSDPSGSLGCIANPTDSIWGTETCTDAGKYFDYSTGV